MAIKREEEKLGAFTLFRDFLRLMRLVEGRWWLVWLCVAGSMAQAGIELALPLLLRKGVDGYALPPVVRVRPSEGVAARLAGSRGAEKAEDGWWYLRADELSARDKADLGAAGGLDKTLYYPLPDTFRPLPDGAGRALSGKAFAPAGSVRSLPPPVKAQVVGPQRKGLMDLAWAYVLLLLLNFGLAYSVTYGLNALGERSVVAMRSALFRHLHRLPIRYFDENPVGRLVTRLTNDTATLSELFSAVLATAASDVALFAGILVILFALDVKLTLILLTLAPPLVALAWWFKVSSQKIYRVIRVHLAKINTFLQESVQGMNVIKSFSAQARASRRFAGLGREYYQAQMRLITIFAVFRPVIDAFATSAVALLVWYGGGQALQGRVSLGTLVAFLIYLKMLFMPLQDLAEKFNIVQSSVVASERLFKILDTTPEDAGAGLKPVAETGRIAFEHVTFGYEPDQPVLRDVSFEVPPGKTLAIVGPTGSGKTTLMSLLLCFYELPENAGAILVDGVAIRDWDTRALRERFALVQQDLFLFAGSLRQNIALYADVAGDHMARCLESSRVSLVMARLPDGLDSAVNERGTMLSQGERQLVSFARALAPGPRILVLDEATASVDSATEMLIQQALQELLKGRTAIVVAHRLSTVQDAHRIVVLHQGRVAEMGTHQELLARAGLYAHLYATQFGGEPVGPS